MNRRGVWPNVSADFVRMNLDGHKLLGLALCAILYLISLSGTATVFYVELGRWETARAPQVVAASPEVLGLALADARAAHPKAASLAIVPPTPATPQLAVAVDGETRLYNGAGRFISATAHPATDALSALHYALSLPSAVGSVVVGLAGLCLVALLLGGLLAHPRILKDAFLWRWRAGRRLSLADLHNRLGVWAAPFHLAIAVSGAIIGLISLILLADAMTFDGGDTDRTSAALFGSPALAPRLGPVEAPALAVALATVTRLQPGGTPTYISIDNPGGDHESLSVDADVPNRLVYGENYGFDAAGRLTRVQGLASGPFGKQAYASLYRLHFGSFGGLWVKAAYVLLGLALCLICSTGFDLWLIKADSSHPRLRCLWAAFVWTSPAAMAMALAAALASGVAFAPVFWSLLAAGSVAGLAALGRREIVVCAGRWVTALSMLVLAATHALVFRELAATPTALGVNMTLTSMGLGLGAFAYLRRPSRRGTAPDV